MKERLTGAIILVVLVVALVPELLSGPKPPPAGQLATTADGAAIRSVSVDLTAPAAPVGAGAAATVPTPGADASAAADAAPAARPSADSLAAGGAGDAAGRSADASGSGPAAAPAEVPTPDPVVRRPRSPAARATASGAATAATAATAASPPAPVPAAATSPGPAATVGKESFVVQAGLFSSRANATRLVRQLEAKGFAARVSVVKNGAGELYRVRIGAGGDRSVGNALLGRVRAAGFSALLLPSPSQVAATP